MDCPFSISMLGHNYVIHSKENITIYMVNTIIINSDIFTKANYYTLQDDERRKYTLIPFDVFA